jgi:hypothetical protein
MSAVAHDEFRKSEHCEVRLPELIMSYRRHRPRDVGPVSPALVAPAQCHAAKVFIASVDWIRAGSCVAEWDQLAASFTTRVCFCSRRGTTQEKKTRPKRKRRRNRLRKRCLYSFSTKPTRLPRALSDFAHRKDSDPPSQAEGLRPLCGDLDLDPTQEKKTRPKRKRRRNRLRKRCLYSFSTKPTR